ncbi:hypothetical protein, partial [Listeria sp. ILCC806]|uniref:hypothetical protein n=1 Tax=Listeria sp. ILCC806 TaxID=1918335 RepID=UPI001C6FC982
LSYELIGETSVSSLFHLRFVQFSKVILSFVLCALNASATFINIPTFYAFVNSFSKLFMFYFKKSFVTVYIDA